MKERIIVGKKGERRRNVKERRKGGSKEGRKGKSSICYEGIETMTQ